ncbi:hypothetical protein [Microbacterium sp. SSM24]|uniref:hypothetical protein n=1 Tax=Microbacterium sp. SSM24 TaxID=2991714 RepID=UPI0022263DA7|nr:hypothetical protein [Microbacterium sp. SSM24]MCW3494222.1 hypothetical protein [Microbacterium sp. SSM24]
MTEIARPVYREGQFLTAADFVAEQAYHRRSLARHEVGEHTWGLIVGLELVEVADPGGSGFVDVFLTPGFAVDGYGRQIVSFERIAVDTNLFNAFLDNSHRSVWIQFAQTSAAPTPEGWTDDCADGEPTRAIETFRLVVDPVDPDTDVLVAGEVAIPEPSPGSSIPADTSVPFQELPEEPPIARWLVRLGSLLWDGAARRFRPAGGRLTEGRRFAGVVAADVLAPAGTLRVARRTAPADTDAADFAIVEGRVRAQGRINAERELWMEGDAIRFTYDAGGSVTDPPLTLVRDRGPAGGEHRLRLTLGDAPAADVSLSVGTTADTADPDPVAEVIADGRVRVPRGPLDMGTTHRQEIELNTPDYGFGTQDGVLYQRSPNMFAWYTGGSHQDKPLDPGKNSAGVQLVPRLVLDAEGSLDFGAVTHQMLKLWSATGTTVYGIGVQPWTLYFRTDADFAWFRDGTHADVRGGAGAGGTLAMKLGEDSTLEVFGAEKVSTNLTVGAGGNGWVKSRHVNGKSAFSDADDHLFLNWSTGNDVFVGGGGAASDLEVSGGMRVRGPGQAAVESVIKVIKNDLQVSNGFTGAAGTPGTWSWNWGSALDECFTVFVVINAFAVVTGSDLFSTNPSRSPSTDVIPQTMWARVDAFSNSGANGRAFLSQSDAGSEGNNAVGITVIAIGRKTT